MLALAGTALFAGVAIAQEPVPPPPAEERMVIESREVEVRASTDASDPQLSIAPKAGEYVARIVRDGKHYVVKTNFQPAPDEIERIISQAGAGQSPHGMDWTPAPRQPGQTVTTEETEVVTSDGAEPAPRRIGVRVMMHQTTPSGGMPNHTPQGEHAAHMQAMQQCGEGQQAAVVMVDYGSAGENSFVSSSQCVTTADGATYSATAVQALQSTRQSVANDTEMATDTRSAILARLDAAIARMSGSDHAEPPRYQH